MVVGRLQGGRLRPDRRGGRRAPHPSRSRGADRPAGAGRRRCARRPAAGNPRPDLLNDFPAHGFPGARPCASHAQRLYLVRTAERSWSRRALAGRRFWERLGWLTSGWRPSALARADSACAWRPACCSHGHDLDETQFPPVSRSSLALCRVPETACKTGAMRGAERIGRELKDGPARARVGLKVSGAPAREGAPILSQGQAVGVVTSGGFSPSLAAPIAMGFVPPHLAAVGTALEVEVRGRRQGAEVTAMPFVPHRYRRPCPPSVTRTNLNALHSRRPRVGQSRGRHRHHRHHRLCRRAAGRRGVRGVARRRQKREIRRHHGGGGERQGRFDVFAPISGEVHRRSTTPSPATPRTSTNPPRAAAGSSSSRSPIPPRWKP